MVLFFLKIFAQDSWNVIKTGFEYIIVYYILYVYWHRLLHVRRLDIHYKMWISIFEFIPFSWEEIQDDSYIYLIRISFCVEFIELEKQ